MSERRIKKKPSSRTFAKPSKLPPAVKPTYEVPKWAGKPPAGMHLDVTKDGKLIEKFIVDGKTHFYFGRQRDYIDFTIDHTSCSRVHAVMVYHKNLQRMFLVDLGSTHGTFLGKAQLEPHRPMQLAIDDVFCFGASTRTWVLREKPNAPQNIPAPVDTSLNTSSLANDSVTESDSSSLSLLGLPEAENELDDLTEFNTAHNRRISTLPMDEANIVSPLTMKRRKSSVSVTFSSEEDTVINPEDVDPSVGRFRNLISTEIIIPTKKSKPNLTSHEDIDAHIAKAQQDFLTAELYPDIPSNDNSISPSTAKSVMPKISSAPDVDEPDREIKPPTVPVPILPNIYPVENTDTSNISSKKKYIKEAWPGRRPKGQNLLSV